MGSGRGIFVAAEDLDGTCSEVNRYVANFSSGCQQCFGLISSLFNGETAMTQAVRKARSEAA